MTRVHRAETEEPKPAFSIRELPLGFVVVDAQGRQVSRVFPVQSSAQGALTRHIRDAGLKVRPCICCRKEFRSEGAHHRMCERCRGNRSDVAEPVRLYITRGL